MTSTSGHNTPRSGEDAALFDITHARTDRPGPDDPDTDLDTPTASHVEWRLANPVGAAAAAATIRGCNPDLLPHRPGEGDPTEPAGPINWHEITDDDYDDTWGALTDYLTWALPHWAFTTDQVPTHCWWQHPDIVEELTAWWGLWQACVRNPTANITDQSTFQERTAALKQRLDHSYRGRCRHEHQPAPALVLTTPDTT